MKSDGGQVYPKRIRALNPDWSSEREIAAGKLKTLDISPDGVDKYFSADEPGMSVRTLAAIEIMAAMYKNPMCDYSSAGDIAEEAVKAADLLIAELEKPCES